MSRRSWLQQNRPQAARSLLPSWKKCLCLFLLLHLLMFMTMSTLLIVIGGNGVRSQLDVRRLRESVTKPVVVTTETDVGPIQSKAVASNATTRKVGTSLTDRAATSTRSGTAAGRQNFIVELASYFINEKSIVPLPIETPLAPTTLNGRIKQASQPSLYRLLVTKLQSLGPAGTDKQLERAASRCALDRGAPAVRYVQSYAFLHRPSSLCSGELLALIAVHSNAKNLARRAAIRRTWGSLRYVGRHRVDVAFFIGRPASGDADASGATGAKLQALIDAESDRYGDIVQLDFIENYRNMTIKHLAVYEWTLAYCPAAQNLVKVDDDTFADVAHLVTFLSRDPPPGFYCSATGGAKPQRQRRGPKAKWMVTQHEYADKSYPTYCEGFGYILRADRVADIYLCSLFKQFFWIDDVHVTGVLASAAGVPLHKFWRGHSYAAMLPSQASETIMDYIFLTAEQSEFFESVWHRLWYAVLQHSLDVNL